MSILVWNSSDKPVHLHSFDGDSVFIGPKAKEIKCAQKFNWNPPPEVKIRDLGPDEVDASGFVKGNMPVMSRRPKKDLDVEGNNKTADEIRALAEQKSRARNAAQLLKEQTEPTTE